MAKDGEGKGLVVLRIFTSDDGEADFHMLDRTILHGPLPQIVHRCTI